MMFDLWPVYSGERFMSLWPSYLVISPLMLFYAYSCQLCNLTTFWNIIMILHSDSYVERVMTMCRMLSFYLS